MLMGLLALSCLVVCGLVVSAFTLKIKGMEVSDGGQHG